MASTENPQVTGQPHLQKQDLATLDITKLTPQSPEVISRQATIGTIGHVANGKSTVGLFIHQSNDVPADDDMRDTKMPKLFDIDAFFPFVKMEKLTQSQIHQLTKHRDHEKNLRTFMKQKRYERRVSKEFRNKKRRRSSMEDLQNKCNAVRQFVEYHSNSDQTTKFQSDVEFFKPKRRKLADIDRYSIERSESSSTCGSSLSNENFRPRRSLTSTIRFKFDNFDTQSKNRAGKKFFFDPNASYTVEQICGINIVNSGIFFLVKWENYSAKHNTWEPLENVRNCNELVLEYVNNELSDLEEELQQAMRKIEMEQKDVIAKYKKKSKKDIMEEIEMKYDPFEFKCSQLLYMLVEYQTGCYNNFRKRFRHQVILKYFLELDLKQMNAHDSIRTEIMDKEMNEFSVFIENDVDFTIFEAFNYTRQNIFPDDWILTTINQIGCECKEGCNRMSKCCPKIMNGNFAYKECNRANKLRLFNTQMIYECSEYCQCDKNCLNRLTQQPRKYPLTIFKTTNGTGWGLRAAKNIPRGAFIIEYTGEIIDQEESVRRGEKYDEIGRSYLFDLDFNENSEAIYTIDAAHYGNLSRLINHSCEPNCRIWPVTNCNHDTSIYKLCYFTTRLIKAGEELTIDYSGGTVSHDDEKYIETEKDDVITGSPSHNIVRKHRTLDACKCGTSTCKGYIFV